MLTNRKSLTADSRDDAAMPLVRSGNFDHQGGTEGGYPTPGEVFGEIGVTLAVFLAIAFFANLLATLLAV